MKKPIGKQRRRYLAKFLAGKRSGWDAANNFYYGLLPESPSHKQGHRYWIDKYYTIYYNNAAHTNPEDRARQYGFKHSPLTDDDIKYIVSLTNIDPFLADEENKEFIE